MKFMILNYILNRLKEASTWRGIIMLVAGSWAHQHPDQAESIIPVAIALAGAIGAFLPDKKKPAVQEDSQDDSAPIIKKPAPQEETVEPSSGWGDK